MIDTASTTRKTNRLRRRGSRSADRSGFAHTGLRDEMREFLTEFGMTPSAPTEAKRRRFGWR